MADHLDLVQNEYREAPDQRLGQRPDYDLENGAKQEGLGPKRKVAVGSQVSCGQHLLSPSSRVRSMGAKVRPVLSADTGAAIPWASALLLVSVPAGALEDNAEVTGAHRTFPG